MDTVMIDGRRVPLLESPNSAQRPVGVSPALIVLHSTEADFDSAVAWLCAPESEVSAHFVVSRTGRIVQLVPVERTAWHAGVSAWQGRALRNSVNAFSVGIEMEHLDGKQDWPPAQVDAVTALCRALLARFNLSPASVVSHAEVALPPGRKVDPRAFPWAAFRAQLATPRNHRAPALLLAGQRIDGRIIQNTLYVPAREVCETLRIEARWDPATQELLAAGVTRS